MFEKFFGRYIETADNGKAVAGEFIACGLSGMVNVLICIFGVLVMVVSFPLWLIGKMAAQQIVHARAAVTYEGGEDASESS